jgi:hypothetical protein
MGVVRELACVLRGGHRWETISDAEGTVTYCGRCDKTRHGGTDVDPPGDPQSHADTAKVADVARNFPP